MRRASLFLAAVLAANVLLAGLHATPSSLASAAAFAGQEMVICSNGVLKRVRIGLDGEPVDPSDSRGTKRNLSRLFGL